MAVCKVSAIEECFSGVTALLLLCSPTKERYHELVGKMMINDGLQYY
jgi:hypothetical protein